MEGLVTLKAGHDDRHSAARDERGRRRAAARCGRSRSARASASTTGLRSTPGRLRELRPLVQRHRAVRVRRDLLLLLHRLRRLEEGGEGPHEQAAVPQLQGRRRRDRGDHAAPLERRVPRARCRCTSFAIQSPTAMTKYGANKGTLSNDGVFVPGGDYGVPGGQAVGTGPFKLESWKIGDKLEIVRNDSYWGRKAFLRRVIFRAIPDNAARLQALQTGEIQGYDLVEPQDIATIKKNKKLKTLDRPAFNVALRDDQPGRQAVRQHPRPQGRGPWPRPRGRGQVVLRGPGRGGARVHAASGRSATRRTSRSTRTTRPRRSSSCSRRA